MWRRRLGALAVGVDVAVESASLAREAEALFACYRDVEEVHGTLRLLGDGPFTLIADAGTAYVTASREEALGALELAFYRHAVLGSPGLLLHAAGLVRDDRAILLAGHSGAGKSTLSRALVQAGAGYLTDERVLVQADRRVVGLPRVIQSVDQTGPWTHRPSHIVHAPVPVAALVVLRHAPQQPPRCARLATGEAALSVWPHAVAST